MCEANFMNMFICYLFTRGGLVYSSVLSKGLNWSLLREGGLFGNF